MYPPIMVQSPEYPDLPFVPPAAFGVGRDGKAVRYIVVHYTAGAERSTSAEDGAQYDRTRDDGVSTHYFVDSNSVVQCVLTRNRANACFHKGNRLGIQYEICGTLQTRAQWLDAASNATITNAARQIARDCKEYGIPVRRLSVAQTRAAWYDFPTGPKGIVGHVDVTNAYPEDGGTHTDPGAAFPWDVLLDRVQDFMTGDNDMPLTSEDGAVVAAEVWKSPALEYADEDGDGRELRTTKDILFATHQASLAAVAQGVKNALALAGLQTDVSNVDEAVLAGLDTLASEDLVALFGGAENAARLRDALNAALGEPTP